MAIVKVQGAFNSSGGTNTATATFGSAPTQGNLLIAIAWGSTNITNAAITGWTLANTTIYGAAGYIGLWYKVAGASEPTGVTVTWTSSTTCNLAIEEWSGLSPTPLDQSASVATTGSAVTSRSSGTTATTAQAEELLLAGFGMGAATGGGESFSNSFTLEANAGTANLCYLASRVVAATGAYECTMTWVTARVAGGLITTFKGAAVAPFPPELLRGMAERRAFLRRL